MGPPWELSSGISLVPVLVAVACTWTWTSVGFCVYEVLIATLCECEAMLTPNWPHSASFSGHRVLFPAHQTGSGSLSCKKPRKGTKKTKARSHQRQIQDSRGWTRIHPPAGPPLLLFQSRLTRAPPHRRARCFIRTTAGEVGQ
jgi:hypothetical protein